MTLKRYSWLSAHQNFDKYDLIIQIGKYEIEKNFEVFLCVLVDDVLTIILISNV